MRVLFNQTLHPKRCAACRPGEATGPRFNPVSQASPPFPLRPRSGIQPLAPTGSVVEYSGQRESARRQPIGIKLFGINQGKGPEPPGGIQKQ